MRNFYPMLGVVSLCLCASLLSAQTEKAPWGLSQMQFGPQYSWSKQTAEMPIGTDGYYTRINNRGIGINGRIQLSFLDLFAYGEDSKAKFRIADIIGFEAGAGYLQDKHAQYDQISQFEVVDKGLWQNVGIDVGFVAMYRVLPKLDLGVKYSYLSHENATFGNSSYVRQDNGELVQGTSGRNLPAYGNSLGWGLSGRFGKFYGEFSHIRGKKEYRTLVNIFDLKYRYAEKKAWAPYVGIQIGVGNTPFADVNYPGATGDFTRNWVQFSIGKMTNF